MGPPEANKAVDAEGGAAPGEHLDGEATGRVPKIAVLRLELPTALKEDAVSHFVEFMQRNPAAIEKVIATDMKKFFDQKHSQTWHCIVGKGFGCSIAYDTQFLLFFQADQHYVLLFKSVE